MVTETVVPEIRIQKLLAMPELDFRSIIDDDTRDKVSAELAAGLRSPQVVGRWYEALMAMQMSVEGQLAAKTAESKGRVAHLKAQGKDATLVQFEQAKFERWKAGAIRFKSGLEQKLLEAKRILRDANDPLISDRTAEERNRALARVALLEDAIRRHRDAFPREDDPSDADEELWGYVGGR